MEKNKRKINVSDISSKKLLGIFVVIIVFLSLLFLRVAVIASTKGSTYRKKIYSQLNYSSITIPHRRGNILDRNNFALAVSKRTYKVSIDPAFINEEKEKRNSTIEFISNSMGIDCEKISSILEEQKDERYVTIENNISAEKGNQIKTEIENRDDIIGIILEEQYTRNYPNGKIFSNAIGFTSNSEGIMGLEKYYNSILSGVDGREYGFIDDNSGYTRNTISSKSGDDIVLTIDLKLQEIVENSVEETFNEEEINGRYANNIGIIIMDPNNGEVLADYSYPNYDPNNPRDLLGFYSSEEVNSMSDEETVEALQKLWNNYTVSNNFEPGSTGKIVTLAAALNNNLVDESSEFYCEGFIQFEDTKVNCNNLEGHGQLNYITSTGYSCNCTYMNIADTVGVGRFLAQQKRLYFGKYTGIDLPSEDIGQIMNESDMSRIDLCTNGFGQNYNCTMIQMASAYCSLVNGGNYYKPHLLKKIIGEDYEEENEPILIGKTVSSYVSEKINTALKETYISGTCAGWGVDGYSIGGKTGTAETLPRGNNEYITSLISTAPAENPEILIYIVVDRVNAPSQENVLYAKKISQKIMSNSFSYLGISK